MTYSVLLATSDALVVGTASCVPGVGRVVPHVRRGTGAAASQALGEPALGVAALDHLDAGAPVDGALAAALADDPLAERRQLAVVVAGGGGAAAHTGNATHDHAGHRVLDGAVVCGNLLASPAVLDAAAEALTAGLDRGPVPAVLAALHAAEAAGGDARGRMSAALRASGTRLTSGVTSVVETDLDVRVDRASDPLGGLEAASRTDLAYALVDRDAEGAGPADLDAAREVLAALADDGADASAAVLYALEVVAGRFGEVALGRQLAERIVAARPGPAADTATVARLWSRPPATPPSPAG